MAAEVTVGAKDEKDEKEIRGRTDLVLTYGTRSDLRAILFIVELRRIEIAGSGLSQIMAYMAAVWDNRKGLNNNSVFGLLSDANSFQFCFLDAKKKFFVTEPLDWNVRSPIILAYIDRILLDAIRSSPWTTPEKERTGNTVIKGYSAYLAEHWRFGLDSNDGGIDNSGNKEEHEETAEESGKEDNPIWDIVRNGNEIEIHMRKITNDE